MLAPIFTGPRPDAMTRASMAMRGVLLRRHNPDDLFEQAQSAEEVGDIEEAEREQRRLLQHLAALRRRFNLSHALASGLNGVAVTCGTDRVPNIIYAHHVSRNRDSKQCFQFRFGKSDEEQTQNAKG